MTIGRGLSHRVGNQISPPELLKKNQVSLSMNPVTGRAEIKSTMLKIGQKGTAWSQRTVAESTLRSSAIVHGPRAERREKRITHHLGLVMLRGHMGIHHLCRHQRFLHLVGIHLLLGTTSQVHTLAYPMISKAIATRGIGHHLTLKDLRWRELAILIAGTAVQFTLKDLPWKELVILIAGTAVQLTPRGLQWKELVVMIAGMVVQFMQKDPQ